MGQIKAILVLRTRDLSNTLYLKKGFKPLCLSLTVTGAYGNSITLVNGSVVCNLKKIQALSTTLKSPRGLEFVFKLQITDLFY